jgi:hypothetical protein
VDDGADSEEAAHLDGGAQPAPSPEPGLIGFGVFRYSGRSRQAFEENPDIPTPDATISAEAAITNLGREILVVNCSFAWSVCHSPLLKARYFWVCFNLYRVQGIRRIFVGYYYGILRVFVWLRGGYGVDDSFLPLSAGFEALRKQLGLGSTKRSSDGVIY